MTQKSQVKRSAFNSAWVDLVALVVGVGLGASPTSAVLLQNGVLHGADAAAVYTALVGLQGTLLGFVLAALAIIAGYSQNDRMQLLRDAGQLPNLFGVYLAATRSYAISTLLALIALLISATAGLYDILACIVGISVVLASVRLVRVLRVTETVLLALN